MPLRRGHWATPAKPYRVHTNQKVLSNPESPHPPTPSPNLGEGELTSKSFSQTWEKDLG